MILIPRFNLYISTSSINNTVFIQLKVCIFLSAGSLNCSPLSEGLPQPGNEFVHTFVSTIKNYLKAFYFISLVYLPCEGCTMEIIWRISYVTLNIHVSRGSISSTTIIQVPPYTLSLLWLTLPIPIKQQRIRWIVQRMKCQCPNSKNNDWLYKRHIERNELYQREYE
jgi:hypothetical protein